MRVVRGERVRRGHARLPSPLPFRSVPVSGPITTFGISGSTQLSSRASMGSGPWAETKLNLFFVADIISYQISISFAKKKIKSQFPR